MQRAADTSMARSVVTSAARLSGRPPRGRHDGVREIERNFSANGRRALNPFFRRFLSVFPPAFFAPVTGQAVFSEPESPKRPGVYIQSDPAAAVFAPWAFL